MAEPISRAIEYVIHRVLALTDGGVKGTETQEALAGWLCVVCLGRVSGLEFLTRPRHKQQNDTDSVKPRSCSRHC